MIIFTTCEKSLEDIQALAVSHFIVESLGLGFCILLDKCVHDTKHILVGILLDDVCDKFLSGLCDHHPVVVDLVVHGGHIVCVCLKHAVAHDIISLTYEFIMLFIWYVRCIAQI